MQSVRGSNTVKTLIWAGLSPSTRKGYQTAIRSYEYFTKNQGVTTWPATVELLEEWTANRLMGSTTPMQGQVKPDTMASYLSAIRSWHVDHEFSLAPFEAPRIRLLLQGGKSFFPSAKAVRLPITKDILTALTSQISPDNINDLNLDAAFKVAWAGFMRLGELTYTHAEKIHSSFRDLHLTRSDITFSEHDQYVTLRLKKSKTDVNHTGALIMLAKTQDPTCPVTALRALFTRDPQPAYAPLFSHDNKSFTRRYVIAQLRSRLSAIGVSSTNYSGHSFWKGAAQHASNNGMLEEDIQKLGRWSGESFRLYYVTSAQMLYNLNMNFQTGRPVALPRATTA